MPLFGGSRDAGFLKSINLELMHQVISNEIVLYKIDDRITYTNIYGEAIDRKYKNGIKFFAKILTEDMETINNNDMIDMQRLMTFAFLKSDLRDKSIVVAEGDIIMYDTLYYEVDDSNSETYWTNRNPNSQLGDWAKHGYDHVIIVKAHLTKREITNIEEVRSGENIDSYLEDSYHKVV